MRAGVFVVGSVIHSAGGAPDERPAFAPVDAVVDVRIAPAMVLRPETDVSVVAVAGLFRDVERDELPLLDLEAVDFIRLVELEGAGGGFRHDGIDAEALAVDAAAEHVVVAGFATQVDARLGDEALAFRLIPVEHAEKVVEPEAGAVELLLGPVRGRAEEPGWLAGKRVGHRKVDRINAAGEEPEGNFDAARNAEDVVPRAS